MLLKPKHKAYIALATTSIIWGTTWVAMKFAIKSIPPMQLASFRQLIAGSIFVIFFLIKKEPIPTFQQFKKIALLAVLTFAMANGLSTWSMKYLTSGLGALIGALYPLSVVVMEYLFFKNNKINTTTIFGILLGICGIAFVFYDNAFGVHPKGYLLGLLLAIIAMLSWSLSSILIAKKFIKINVYFSMGWQMLISSILLGVLSFFSEKTIALSAVPPPALLASIYLIIAGSIVAIIAFVYSMKHLNPAIAVLYAYINPIVAMVTGAIILGEKITITIIIGSVITLIGVYLVNYSMRKNTKSIAV